MSFFEVQPVERILHALGHLRENSGLQSRRYEAWRTGRVS